MIINYEKSNFFMWDFSVYRYIKMVVLKISIQLTDWKINMLNVKKLTNKLNHFSLQNIFLIMLLINSISRSL